MQVCATSGMETFQEEQQKAIDMFFEGNPVLVSLYQLSMENP